MHGTGGVQLQLMPAGVLVTEPGTSELPPACTVSVRCVSKSAVTLRSMLMVTVHVGAVPLQSPPHCLKTDPAFAVAVSVTTAPGG